MRLFIDTHYFISVIQEQGYYSCQVMELVHGNGMHSADITTCQKDVVSCIVHEGFTETSKRCKDLQEIADFHLKCLLDLDYEQWKNECELNSLENQTYEG